MAEIKMGQGSLYIYTHWHGFELPDLARAAVEAASSRLGDEPYYVRILLDQIMQSGRDKLLGWGILLRPEAADSYNDDKPSVIIDTATGIVEVKGKT